MANLVTIKNRQAVVSSRQVAKSFWKEHKNVLVNIKEILAAENSATRFFMEATYENRGKQYPEYFMNRDGFTLLTMGFTGREALQWKIEYIRAFNEMETQTLNSYKMPKTYGDALQLAAQQAKQLEMQAPKVAYHDAVLDACNFMTTTEVAKSAGFKSAFALNDALERKGVIYRVGYRSYARKPKSNYPWVFTADYVYLISEGYAKIGTCVYVTPTSCTTAHSIKWSERGKKWLCESFSAV